ncbi:tatD [Mytilus coruscus]|uniref:TatD n=1 Tax=Mytilus coruscus TaxID=42192 RepID=A0A6J8AVR3_MYTCO|nr:tatD [Mytilus coruscus]
MKTTSDKDETEVQKTQANHINGATLVRKREIVDVHCVKVNSHTLFAHIYHGIWLQVQRVGVARFNLDKQDDGGCKYTEEEYAEKWVELANGYLKQISNALGFKEIIQACDYFNQNRKYRDSCHQSIFLDEDVSPILSFNRINHFEPDTAYMKPYPVVSLSSLLHWKVLSLLVLDSGYLDITTEQSFQLYRPPVNINYVDSHFHMDKLRWRIGSSDFPQFNTDREDFLQLLLPKELDKIVNHERLRTLQIWLEDLDVLLDSKKVVAVGECGLDRTDRPSSKEYEKQKDILRKQEKIAKHKRLPVEVIHI